MGFLRIVSVVFFNVIERDRVYLALTRILMRRKGVNKSAGVSIQAVQAQEMELLEDMLEVFAHSVDWFCPNEVLMLEFWVPLPVIVRCK